MARGARKARDDLDELSRLFLELRERAGLTQPDAASRAGITQSMLSRAETGRGVPNSEITSALARLYTATAQERQRLLELVAVMKPARMDSRLIMQRGKNLRFQERVRDIEQSCALVRAYQPHMILGGVQTPAYAREVFRRERLPPERTYQRGQPRRAGGRTRGPLPATRRREATHLDADHVRGRAELARRLLRDDG